MHLTNETKVIIGIVIVTIALVLGAVFFLSQPEKPIVVDASKLVKADSNVLATGSGQLTIVEFGDYQCPACGAAHGPLKQAISEYPGQIEFVFRHYPLVQHRNAELAAKVAEAAKIQGKMNEMHDTLYEKQTEWDEEGNAMEFFKKYATDLGMDVAKFEADVNSGPVGDKVRNDFGDGNSVGVSATPTIYFNSNIYKGGFGVDDFKAEIEKYLNSPTSN